MCDTYLKAWQKDLRAWAHRLQELPCRDSAEAALSEFGLRAAGGGHLQRGVAVSMAGRAQVPSGQVAIPQAATADLLERQWGARQARGRHRKTHRSVDERFGREPAVADLAELSRAAQMPGRPVPVVGPVAASGPCAAS